MNHQLFILARRSLSLIILFVVAGLLLTSCSRKFRFESSAVVPAAEGSVKIKKDRNKNYSVTVKTVNLTEAERLDPPRSLYVVWMHTEFNGTKNIGQFKTSSGLFSKKLKASLTTVTPFKPVQIFITAEENGNVSYPGLRTVLTTGLIRVR